MRITLDSGEEYEVPNENARAAMQALDRRGLKFDATEALGDMTVGEPEVIKTPQHGASGGWEEPANDVRPWYQKLKEGAQSVGETAHDAYLGATHGATMGLADDAAGVVSPATAETWRTNEDAARQRSPTAFAAGDMATSMLMPVGRIVKGAGALAGAGNAAVNAGGQAFGRAFGDSDPEAPIKERALHALEQGEIGAATGGAVSGVMSGLGAGAKAVGNYLDDKSVQARSAAVGATGADLRKLAERRGLDYATGEVGRMPEELGVTNKLWPISTAGYEKRLGARAGQANNQIDRSIADAEKQNVGAIAKQQSRKNILNELATKETAARAGVAGDRESRAAALGSVREGIAQQRLNTPTQLRAQKSALDRLTYPDAVKGSPESTMGEAHAAGGHAIRNELRGVMSYARDDTNQAFTRGNEDYSRAALLHELAQKKAATQYAGGGMAGNIGAGAVGAAVGFGVGGPGGIIPGASLGMARPAYAAAQQFGPDLGANLARLGSNASESAGRLATATGSPESATGLARLGMMWSDLSSGDAAQAYEEERKQRREGR